MKEGWSYKKLGEVARVQNGFAFDSKLFNEYAIGTPLIRIRDIKRAYTMTYTTETCSTDYIIEDGHVLISMDGDFNVCIWKGGHAYLNQRVCRVVPSDVILPRFIYYFLPFPLKRINDKTSFSTVKHLSSKQVNEMLVPIPPLQEQHSIVTRLDAAFSHIDALKANAEKQVNETRKLFQAELTECMKPKEGWEEKSLGDVSSFQNGFAFKSNLFKKEGFPIIRISNIQNEAIQTDDIVYFDKADYPVNFDNYKIYPQDILIAMSGGTTGKLGINTTDTIFYQNQRVGVIRENKKFLDHGFLFYFLHTKSEESLKIAAGAAQPNLSTAQIKGFIIPAPQLEVQRQIVTHLDSLSSNIRKLEELQQKTIAECDALKQAMLREIFE